MSRKLIPLMICVVLVLLQAQAGALLIHASYHPSATTGIEFTENEKSIIQAAIQQWSALLPCNDGLEITINFQCNNDLGANVLGAAYGWQVNENGNIISAWVQINNAAVNWTLGDPEAGSYDAHHVLKHEIAHAIGFTVNVDRFGNNVKTVDGNRFYDYNGDGIFNDGDFDLVNDPGMGTHAVNENDLMYAYAPLGVRLHPTLHHALILSHAYGYCIPEPATIIILGTLGASVTLARKFRKRQAA